MVNRLMIPIAAMLLACLAYAQPPPPPAWQILEKEGGLHVSLDRLLWRSFPLQGDVVLIRATGAASTRKVGWPELPIYRLLFAVPPGVQPTLVTATSRSVHQKGMRVSPVGTWSSGPQGFSVERRSLIGTAEQGLLYPDFWARVSPWGQFRGLSLHVLEVAPLQQELGTGTLVEQTMMEMEIRWSDGSGDGPPVEEPYLPLVRSMVINPSQAEKMATSEPRLKPSLEWEPSFPGLKITPPPHSPVVITGDDIAGVDPELAAHAASTLSLWWKGEKYPCVVETDEDGNLNRLTFVSPTLPEEYAHETFTNVFWFGPGDGFLSMEQRSGAPQGAPDHEQTVHPVFTTTEIELTHTSYNREGNALLWWWDELKTKSAGQVDVANLNFRLGEIDSSHPLTMTVRGSAESWRNHRIRLTIVGQQIADTTWAGSGSFEIEADIPADFVYQGTNIVRVELVGQTGEDDIVQIKGLDLAFETGVATDNILRFMSPNSVGGKIKFALDGFSEPDLFVFDVTEEDDPATITEVEVNASSRGYSVVFHDSVLIGQQRTYLVFGLGREQPDLILESRSAGVLAAADGADYMVLTPALLLDQAQRLADYRASLGYQTLTVDVEEVFDRFSFGYPASQGVADFIAWAYASYEPRPGFVVLMGDGSARLRHGNETSPNLFPDRLINRVADDNDYVDVDNDPHHLPDLAIGRLSVQTTEQAEEFVDKIIAAETEAVPSPAHARIALFADDASGSAHLPGFAYDCEELIESVSPAYFPERIYLSYNGGSNNAWNDREVMLASRAKGEEYYKPWILETLGAGTLLFTYVGHGGINTWATEWIITTDDAPDVLTAPNYPLIMNFSCDTGRFDDPDHDIIMAEHFTRWREGALAYFSSSRESYPSDNQHLSVNLHKALLDRGIREIGLAIQSAKYQTDLQYVCRAYSLLGDPASVLPVPQNTNLALAVEPSVVGADTEVGAQISWPGSAAARVFLELADAYAQPLASEDLADQTLPVTLTGLATPTAPPPGTGHLRVYAQSGALEALGYAEFTSPANVDTGLVTSAQGSNGWIASRDGNFLISIPPGAVVDSTILRISSCSITRIASQRHMDFAPLPGSGGGEAYEVSFDSGEALAQPAIMTLAYDPNWLLSADADSLQLSCFDHEHRLWFGLGGMLRDSRIEGSAAQLGMFTVIVVYDISPPRITRAEVAQEEQWLVFHDGEFVREGDLIRLTLADDDGIDASALRVIVGGNELSSTYEAMDATQREAYLTVELPELDGGTHEMSVMSSDIYGNSGSEKRTLRVGSGLQVAGFAPVPSPFSSQTHFRYVLSEEADEAIVSLYTVTGRLIQRITHGGLRRGTNTISWDGRDHDGDRIAAGVYFVRLTVKGISGKASARSKVVKRAT